MFDWDDLRPFLAVARHGSTTAAARALGLDQSTVQRRLAALEQRIGQPLVERHPTGCCLTTYGQSVLPHAEAVERQVAALQDHIRRSARELNGIIRLTCPEPLVGRINKSPLLDHLRTAHPGLRIEFVMGDRSLDLGQGDADVALRPGDTSDGRLVGSKVADSLWAVYASRDHVAAHGLPADLDEAAQRPWVGLDASMADHRAMQWMRRALPGARIAATGSSVLGLVQSAKAGVGLAALPTALGDAESDLVRVLGPVPELTRIWRLLTTRALRGTPRVAAFFDFMAREGGTLRPILTG